tara:strand:+ start:1204 stop:1404 length:201 start_codon:yes stop_codon:yes gene_type:complete
MEPNEKLKSLVKKSQHQCSYAVDVKQRDGRKARKAVMKLSYENISIKKPKIAKGAESLNVNIIICR